MENQKSILVIGAGAIGGYVGGSLAAAGHSVAFICRPRTASLIREYGLHLDRPEGSSNVIVEVFESATEAFSSRKYDLIVLAVKRYDTVAAVTPLKHFIDDLPPILNLQNGVGAEEQLQNLLLNVEVIPGTVTTAVGRPEPNQIAVERYRGIGVAGPHPDAEKWVTVFNQAGLGGRYYPDAKSMKWSKLVTNLIANPVSAILDISPLEIFADADLFRIEMFQLREALAVMRKLGAEVVDLPGTPVRLLSFCAQNLPFFIAKPLLGQALGKGRGEKMPSFHGDLHNGIGKSEIDFLHGAVVKEGLRLGVPTPVNQLLTETLLALISGERNLEDFRRRPELIINKSC